MNQASLSANKIPTNSGCVVLAFIGLLIYFGMQMCEPIEKPKEVPFYEQDNSTGAWVFTKMLVENSLKSPGSAKFPLGASMDHVHKKGNTYTIISYVDSQNSFGALLRTEFICILEEKSKDVFDVVTFEMY